jgi:RNA polymerase sigma factor (sigma-70 family)
MQARNANRQDLARATADQLIGRRLRDADEAALAEVYDGFSAVVFGIATLVTGDHSAAEDVTQAVFVQIWEQADRFDAARGSLRAWITTIAHRRAVDWVRREVAHRRLPPTMDQIDLPSAEEEVVRRQISDRVHAAVQRLPVPQRTIVLMTYYEGRTLVEAAAALGIPEGTAKSRMRSALQRLNGWLAAEGVSA